MKNKKFTGKQIKLIINVISVIIFAVSYLYVNFGFVNKTEATYKEKEAVLASINDQKDKLAGEDKLQGDVAEVKAKSQAILDSYPVQIAKEDNFMFVEQLEDALNITITSIDTTDSAVLYQTILPIRDENGKEIIVAGNGTATNAAGTDGTATNGTGNNGTATNATETNTAATNGSATNATGANSVGSAASSTTTSTTANGPDNTQPKTMTLMQSTVTLTFQTTYKGFKKVVDYIRDCPDRTIIDSASVSYDSSTGELTGSLVLKRFALTGTGKVYQPPYIDNISVGTDNIFGTKPDKKSDTSIIQDNATPALENSQTQP